MRKTQILLSQKYQCANCSKVLLNAAWECDHSPRIHESHKTTIAILCTDCHTEKSSEEQSEQQQESIEDVNLDTRGIIAIKDLDKLEGAGSPEQDEDNNQ